MPSKTRKRNNKSSRLTNELNEGSEEAFDEQVGDILSNDTKRYAIDERMPKMVSITGRPSYQTNKKELLANESLQSVQKHVNYISSKKYQGDNITASLEYENNDTSISKLKQNHKRSVGNFNSRNEDKRKPDNSVTNICSFNLIICLSILIFIVYLSIPYISNTYSEEISENSFNCMNLVEQKYPKQKSDLWKTIKSGINHTIDKETVSSYILLYKHDAKRTISKLIDDLSKCVICQLRSCDAKIVDFQETIKNFSEVMDYGSALRHFKDELSMNGLMVVENMDTISEKFALAFHNLCDEVTPIVKETVVFFTLMVDDYQFEESFLIKLKYVEELLRQKWKNMEEDKFMPLFTRISAMILDVYSED